VVGGELFCGGYCVDGVDSLGADASKTAATTNATTANTKNPNFIKKVKKFTLNTFLIF